MHIYSLIKHWVKSSYDIFKLMFLSVWTSPHNIGNVSSVVVWQRVSTWYIEHDSKSKEFLPAKYTLICNTVFVNIQFIFSYACQRKLVERYSSTICEWNIYLFK